MTSDPKITLYYIIILLTFFCGHIRAEITAADVVKQIKAEFFEIPVSNKWLRQSKSAETIGERHLALLMFVESHFRLAHSVADEQQRMSFAKCREVLRTIIQEAPHSWQAQIAYVQMMGAFSGDGDADLWIATATEALAKVNFLLLNWGNDPRLVAYKKAFGYDKYHMRDFFLLFRAYKYAECGEIEKARKDYDQIGSEDCREQMRFKIKDAEEASPALIKRWRQQNGYTGK